MQRDSNQSHRDFIDDGCSLKMSTQLRTPRKYRHKRYGTLISVIGYDNDKRVYFKNERFGVVEDGMLPARVFMMKYERAE